MSSMFAASSILFVPRNFFSCSLIAFNSFTSPSAFSNCSNIFPLAVSWLVRITSLCVRWHIIRVIILLVNYDHLSPLLAGSRADSRDIFMTQYHANQKPAEEKPGENPDCSGSRYIRHGEADKPVNQIHEDDGVGGVQKHSDRKHEGNETETPKQNILNAAAH